MKRLLSAILALAMCISAVTCALADDGSGKKDVGPHEHEIIKMANAVCHYEECQICFELFNVGAHTFKDGKCTVCGNDEIINPFTDVSKDAWYYDEVDKAVKTGIINGKTKTEFKPDDFLTYAEAIKLAACMNQVHETGVVTLKNGNPWYQTYVDYCKEKGIITKNYSYNTNASREGYIEIFAKALPDSSFKDINNIPNGSILDVKDNSPYAIYIYKLYRAGIVTGVDAAHNCNPAASIKRSEVATIISRMMNEEERQAFDMPGTSDSTKDEDADKTKDEEPVKTEGEKDPVPEVTDETGTVEGSKDIEKVPTQIVGPEDGTVSVTPTKPYEGGEEKVQDTPLSIHKQPEGSDEEMYGTKYELEVSVFGGKAPYTYQWYYYTGYRNNTEKIEDGDNAKDVTSAAMTLTVTKDNPLLGLKIYCVITDSAGAKVTTDTAVVYGPFSMPVDSYTGTMGNYTLVGKVSDGILKKGEKVAVIRNSKVIAIGIAEDLQMFSKSLDKTVKGDNVGIVFKREEGVTPSKGDIVVRYTPLHVLDTRDVIN